MTIPTLLVDSTLTPYANITVATAAIADQIAGCLVEGIADFGTYSKSGFTASFSGGILSIDETGTDTGPVGAYTVNAVCRIYLTAIDGLSVDYNLTSSPVGVVDTKSYSVTLYADDQTSVIDSVSSASPFSGTFAPTITDNGYYWLRLRIDVIFTDDGSGSGTISATATGGASLLPCIARAAYGVTPDYVVCT